MPKVDDGPQSSASGDYSTGVVERGRGESDRGESQVQYCCVYVCGLGLVVFMVGGAQSNFLFLRYVRVLGQEARTSFALVLKHFVLVSG